MDLLHELLCRVVARIKIQRCLTLQASQGRLIH
jgi:hypothetical protein